MYYSDMMSLPADHPKLHEYQMIDSSFAPIPVDQAVEETVNKDTQTSGGTKGFFQLEWIGSQILHNSWAQNNFLSKNM